MFLVLNNQIRPLIQSRIDSNSIDTKRLVQSIDIIGISQDGAAAAYALSAS